MVDLPLTLRALSIPRQLILDCDAARPRLAVTAVSQSELAGALSAAASHGCDLAREPPSGAPSRKPVRPLSAYPWIGVMAAGYAFGPIFRFDRADRMRWAIGLGAAVMAGFIALRVSNLYGDPAA